MQRREERIALANWQKLWSANRESGGDNKEVLATNYSRRGSHNDFVEKFIFQKQLAREKKMGLREARVRMRAEARKRVKEMKSREEEEEEENLTGKSSNSSKIRVEKRRMKQVRKYEKQCLRDNEVRKEREEKRKLQIEELRSAQV